MTNIIDNVFLSSIAYAKDPYFIKTKQIKYVLIVAKELQQYFPKKAQYKQIAILDKPDTRIINHFQECIDFIKQANQGNILVHCYGGQSRSVTVICAYLMQKLNISAEEALTYVKSKHRRADPNKGFIQQLGEWEQQLKQDGQEMKQDMVQFNQFQQ